MNKKKITVVLSILLVSMVFITCEEPNGVEITKNELNTYDGYDYEFWVDDRGAGNGKMILTGNGSFWCKWNKSYNILMRVGKKYNRTQKHNEIGKFVLEYEMTDYNPTGTSYATVYGWCGRKSTNDLVEFYIIENWGSSGYKGASGTPLKTVTINGGTYDIYRTQRVNQPSIDGDATFYQYWSIRRTKRSKGTINISEHFEAWDAANLKMGNMYEVSFCIEAFGEDSSGKAYVKKNKLMVNGKEINK